jgi:hypothetical protein
MVSSTSITRTSSTGRSSQKRLADAINFVAEAATFANGLDGMDAGAGKSKKGLGQGQSGGLSIKARKKEKEREVEMEVEGDHEMEEGPPDEGEGMGGKALKGKGKKPRGTDQEKGQEKPEVKASAKGKGKLAKENIKWNGVEGVNRCERCVSAKQKVCLRPAPGSTSNGIPVTACKSCKEKKTKCQWLVEGKTDNVINTDEEEEVSPSPPAKEASGSRHGGSKGSKPTVRPRTRSQSRARDVSLEPIEVDDMDFHLGLQQQLVSPIKKIPPNTCRTLSFSTGYQRDPDRWGAAQWTGWAHRTSGPGTSSLGPIVHR